MGAKGIIDFYDIPSGDAFDVSPDEAIKYFKAKGLKPTFSYGEMLNEAHDNAFTVAKMMDVDLLGKMRDSLESAAANGTLFRDWAEEIIPQLQAAGWWGRKEMISPITGETIIAQLGSPRRLETIFRTNLQAMYAAGQWESYVDQAESAPFLMYDAVDDLRTRAAHAAWDNKVLPIDSTWWQTHFPPNGWNCFPADEPVIGEFTDALKVWYSGELAEIYTSNGNRLRVTANHPVLTAAGWKLAKDVDESDYLIHYIGNGENVTLRAIYNQQGVALAQNVFESFRAKGIARTDAPTPSDLDFYGDGRFMEPNVDVITSDRFLRDNLKPGGAKPGNNGEFIGSDFNVTPLLACFRDLDSVRVGVGLASDAFPRPGALPGDGFRVGFDTLPFNEFLLRPTSDFNARVNQSPADSIATDPVIAGQFFNGLTASVRLGKVTKVRRVPFSGHVYDFQTTNGLIIASGVLVSNCRCGVIQLDADDLESLGYQVSPTPNDGSYIWKNPATGQKLTIPNGLDPGFAHNPGLKHSQNLKDLLKQKAKSLYPSLKEAVAKFVAGEVAESVPNQIADEMAAGYGTAKAQELLNKAKKAAQDAQAKSAKAAANKAAESELNGIWANGSKYQQEILEQLNAEFPDLDPADLLPKVNAAIADYQLKKNLSSYAAAVAKGEIPKPSLAAAFNSLDDLDKEKVLQNVDKLKAKYAKQAEAAKIAQAANVPDAPEPPAQVVAVVKAEGAPPNMDKLTQTGEQKGSNKGGKFRDTTTGQEWYIKTPNSEEMARNEVLAGKFYELAGIDVPEMHIVQWNGQTSIASRIVDGLGKDAAALPGLSGTAEGFAVDAWLANWDVVGLSYDNLLRKGAKAIRVDTGGALIFRAQGGTKGAAFGDSVTEIESLRKPYKGVPVNDQAHKVFGNLTEAQIEASVARVAAITDEQIEAVVEMYGYADKATSTRVIATLKARRDDLMQRYPNAVKAAQKPPTIAETPDSAFTEETQKLIRDSRGVGYEIPTDSDQIEDFAVVVKTYTGFDGKPRTKAAFKLLPAAADKLAGKIKSKATGFATDPNQITIDGDSVTSKAIELAKGANMQSAKGELWRPEKEYARAQELKKLAKDYIDKLTIHGKASGAEFAKAQEFLKLADDVLAHPQDKVGFAIGKINSGDLPTLKFKLEPKQADALPQAGFFDDWEKRSSFTYARLENDGKNRLKEVANESEIGQFDGFYGDANSKGYKVDTDGGTLVKTLPDGTQIKFITNAESNSYATRGYMEIITPGDSVAATSRAFKTLEELGIPADNPTDVDLGLRYANQFGRLQFFPDNALRSKWGDLYDISDKAAQLEAKIKFINQHKGASFPGGDIRNSDGWAKRAGQYQAFGTGRRFTERPDLVGAEWEKFRGEYNLYHNLKGLSRDAGDTNILDRLKLVFESGGSLISLTERVKRGTNLKSTSGASDMNTGGASYVFTRIKKTRWGYGSGIYWDANLLRRADAVSYDSDNFGNVKDLTLKSERLGRTIDEFKKADNSGSNETIFKHQLSVFDGVKYIITGKDEYNDVLEYLRANGYNEWADGRKLTDVIKPYGWKP